MSAALLAPNEGFNPFSLSKKYFLRPLSFQAQVLILLKKFSPESRMVRKSDKIRAIFKELRQATGPDAAAADLIKLAHFIFRTYNREPDVVADRSGIPRFRSTIENMPVDQAMKDGGWKILYFESDGKDPFASDNEVKRLADVVSIRRYLGESWPNHLVRG